MLEYSVCELGNCKCTSFLSYKYIHMDKINISILNFLKMIDIVPYEKKLSK